jgi:hypothetical protein
VRRKLFNLAAAVSLLLFVTMAAFCLRSQFGRIPYVEFKSEGFGREMLPASVGSTSRQWREFEAWDRHRWSVHIRANPNGIFAFGRQPFYGYPANSFAIHFYYAVWLPALSVLPAVWAWHRWRAAARPPGLCPTCGYDCRGPAVGSLLPRCPECGTDLPSPTPATDDQHGPCPSP